MNKKFALIAVLAVLTGCWTGNTLAAPGVSGFGNLRAKTMRMPYYEGSKLVFYVRSNSVALRGKQLEAVRPVIDIIRNNVTAETVANSDCSANVYPLDAPLEDVITYWKNRAYSDGVLISDTASVDQISRGVSSKKRVFLRTPQLDLDGVGFSVDMNRQRITVTSKVKIVLRNNGSQSLGLPDGTEQKESGDAQISISRIYCDRMVLDVKRNVINLYGNVRVDDASGTITSDQLELQFMADKSAGDRKDKQRGMMNGYSLSSGGLKLKLVKFTGSVRMSRNNNGSMEKAACDVFIYHMADNLISLDGNVRLEASADEAALQADELKIILKDVAKAAPADAQKQSKSAEESGQIDIFGEAASKEVVRVEVDGNVRMSRKNQGAQENVTAEKITYDAAAGLLHLQGNVHLSSTADEAIMQSDELLITLKDAESGSAKASGKSSRKSGGSMAMLDASSKQLVMVKARGNVRMSRKNQGAQENVTAEKITYDAADDLLYLQGNVHLSSTADEAIMQSDELLIKLKDAESGSAKASGKSSRSSGGSMAVLDASSKQLVMAKALGNVRMSRKNQGAQENVSAEEITYNAAGDLLHLRGNVHLSSTADEAIMQSDELLITLKDAESGSAKASGKSSRKSGGSMAVLDASSKQLVMAKALGNVRMSRKNQGISERATAEKITYDAANGDIIMHGGDELVYLQRGGDSIKGGSLIYNLDKQRLQVRENCNIVISQETVGSGNVNMPGQQGGKGKNTTGPVTVEARNANLDFGGNNLEFVGNVKVRGQGMKLDGQRLIIELADQNDGKKTASAKSSPASGDMFNQMAARKQLRRIVVVGDVYAEDAGGKVQAQRIDVYFSDRSTSENLLLDKLIADGNVYAEDASGKVQAGRLEIYLGSSEDGKLEVRQLIAKNKLHVENKPGSGKKDTAKRQTLLGNSASGVTSLDADSGNIDLVKDESDFYGNVVVKDESVSLQCDHLHIKTGKVAAQEKIRTLEEFKAQDEFPDRLALGEGRELIQIVARGKVKVRRVLPEGDIQRASGELAVYTVRERKVILEGRGANRAQAVAENSGMVGDKVIINLDTEELEVENGDVLTTLEGMDF